MKKKTILTLAIAAVVCSNAAADMKNPNVLDLKSGLTDTAIVFPESFEADTHKLLESWYMKNYTATDRRYETEPDAEVSDAVIVKRLKSLPTVIEMPFNGVVREYIDRYTKRGRAQVAAILGLSNYYMPVFEQALEEQGLPIELKYLPIVESSLDPNAVSKHGAAGLWQFMIGTAKGLGMEVNSLVDERRDPYVSSERAAAYLKDLYAVYGDWSLAIAAYNCGPGTVNKAIRRAGGDAKAHDFWSIYNYLPEETRGYVPMFIATNYVMKFYPQHNISPVLPVKPLVTDTLQVSERVHFNQISGVLDIPVEELRVLNPQFRADIIPGSAECQYTLILPSQQIHAYLMSENAIHSYDAEKYGVRGTVEPGELPSGALAVSDPADSVPADMGEADVALAAAQGKPSVIIHKVAAGESLSSIAERYGVTPAEIKAGNNLRRNAVRVGQQLKISTTAPGVAAAQAPAETAKPAATPAKAKPQPAAGGKATNHTVKKGETLSVIARKYGVTVAAIKQANGMKSDALRAGQNLKIPAKTAAKAPARKAPAKKSSSKKRR